MNVILYTRVSTKEQIEGYSLTYQEKLCKEYAERMGWNIVEIFQEQGESAKTADRTQLLKLLKFCHENKGKIDILLVHKLDRFSRNTADHSAVRAALLKVGVKLRSVSEQIDDTPAGKLMENIFSSIAQFDNDVRSDRTKEGMKEKARQGHWPWKAPIGYKNSPVGLIIDNDRAPMIKIAFEIYGKGGYTVKSISTKLNKLGLRTERNKKITPQLTAKIFKNKLYMGVIAAWGEDHEGAHEALVSKELFHKVNAIRLGKSVIAAIPHISNNPNFPLKNILKCSDCDKRLTGSNSKGRKLKYSYYHCTCGGVRVRREILEGKFYEYIKTIQPNKELTHLFQLIVRDVWKRKHQEEEKSVRRIDGEIMLLNNMKDTLLKKNLEGIVSNEDYKSLVKKFNDTIIVKEIERGEFRVNETNIDHLMSLVESLFDNVSSLWFEASFEDKQRFQALIFPKGLSVNKSGFGTTTLGLPFNLIGDFAGNETTLVTPREFESRFSE